MKKRVLSVLLAIVMVVGLLPTAVFAQEHDESLCAHHTAHTAECGYAAARAEQPCGHEHTADCYTAGVLPDADDNNVYELGEDTNALDCRHEHDDSCGYAEAVDEIPCGYACGECAALMLLSTTAPQAAWGASEDSLTESGTLATALAAAAEDSDVKYIQLKSAVTLAENETLTVTGGSFTLDLNGQTISGTTSGLKQSGGALTVCDTSSSKNGQITGGTYGISLTGGDLTLKSGSVSGGQYGIYSNNYRQTNETAHIIRIEGGSVSAQSSTKMVCGIYMIPYYGSTLEITGGTISAVGTVADAYTCGVRFSGGGNTQNTLTISDGTISATADRAWNTLGLWIENKIASVTISGTASISAGSTCTASTSRSYTVAAVDLKSGSLTVEGGTLTTDTDDNCSAAYVAALYDDRDYDDTTSTLTIKGGTLELKQSKGSGIIGTVISFWSKLPIYLSGAPVVTAEGAPDFAISPDTPLTFVDNTTLTQPATPYTVAKQPRSSADYPWDFTKNWTKTGIADADFGKYFTAYSDDYRVLKNAETGELLLNKLYTISFHNSYGTSPDSQKLLAGEKVTKPADPVRENYKLNHWCTSSSYCSNGETCTNAWDFDTDTVIASDTLYAVWERTHWTVTFDANNSTANTTQSVPVNGTATQPADAPTRQGHSFSHWCSVRYCSNYTNCTHWSFDTAITADTRLYAVWEPYAVSISAQTDKLTAVTDPEATGWQWNSYTVTEKDFAVTTTDSDTEVRASDYENFDNGKWSAHDMKNWYGSNVQNCIDSNGFNVIYFIFEPEANGTLTITPDGTIPTGCTLKLICYPDPNGVTPTSANAWPVEADKEYALAVLTPYDAETGASTATLPTLTAVYTKEIGTSTPIDGETASTFTNGEDGKQYTVAVTWADGATAASAPATFEASTEDIIGTVTISGTAKYGETLTANYSGNAGTSVTYQWYRGNDSISGATGKTYTLTADDVGQTITVKVSGTGNFSGTVTSEATSAVTKAIPGYTAPSAISGLAYTGQPQELITAAEVTGGTLYYALGGANNPTGDWSTDVPTGTDVKTYYVWYKIVGDPGYEDVAQACVPVTIGKAAAETTPDSSSYTIDYTAETITFSNPYEVSTENGGTGNAITSGSITDYLGSTIYIRTKATPTHNPSDWVAISIAARPVTPGGVAVTNETFDGRGDGSITGITAEMEYKIGTGAWIPGPADLTGLAADTQITVRVKATEAAPHGEEQTYTVSAGDTLTVTFDAQNGSAVAPVTGLSYNATLSQLPETTRTGYTFGGWWTEGNGGTQLTASTLITANITYYAKWTPAALTGTVTVSGSLQVGQTLTATVSNDTNNTGTLSYQWYRGEEAISGATTISYALVAADAGKTIKCVVSSSIQTGAVTSAATAAIAKLNAPAAPTGLTVSAPSAPGASDGKITGVSTAMEYSADGVNWTSCTGAEMTGLGSGTYYVRIAETGDTDAGASVTIVVPAVYTVTFEANGGSEVTPVYVVHGNKVAKPTNPAKSRFIFAGWYTAAEGGVQYDFNAAVTGGLTLFAQWSSEPVYDITGEVDQAQENGEPTPANGVKVTLCQGNTVLFTKITDANGKYDFHAPAGIYNIVAEKDGKTMTQLITVTDHNEQVSTIVLPYQNVSSKLTIPVGTPNVVVGGLDEEVVENSNFVGTATSTTHVALTMTVEQKEDVTSSEAPENAELKAEQEEIKTEAGSQSENLTFFTIDLSKITTTNQGPGESEEVTNTANLLEIIIPFETSGRLSFKVYRYHSSDVDVLTTTANGDGEHIEVGNGMITIHARKFSTYAIGYTVQTSGGSYTPTYAITVEKAEHGTIKANRTYASYGSTVTITTEPEDGYVLSGLTVTDSQGNKIEATDKGDGTYTFKMPRRKVTVTAVFTMSGSYSICPGDSSCPIYPFTDADPSAWYHDGVHYCIDNGLMAGYGNGIFKPDADTTRAMITVMLWRLEGSPVVNYLLDFEDVEEGKWYTEAVRWAKSEGIAAGYGNGYFGTNDPITREQMVTILWRYAQHKGYDVSVGEDTNILSFDDAFDVSEYAIPAMQWACGSGMVQGMNDPNGEGMVLAPESKGTRAQIATMMMRFCEEILK